ncbi:MAG: tetratricopeptide repeat protein, partial [Gemmatimonadota bacterium]
ELYRRLIEERPADLELRHELARLYMWAERYGPAEAELRALVADAPDVGRYRLDLARVLYWDDRPEEARSVLADFPADDADARTAAELDRELARLLTPPPEPDPPPPTLAERARRATADGDFATAAELYRRAVAAAPSDSALALERIDFLQYRLEDLDGAIAALRAYDEHFGLDRDGRHRLARLHLWTERDGEARRLLEALVRDHPDHAESWSLLGDARRYADERAAAREAYRRALALDESDERAVAGLAELDRLRGERIAARESFGAGPRLSLFTDSDDFLQLDAGGGAGWAAGTLSFDASGGYRRIEGIDLAGLPSDDRGGFASLEVAHWWSEASVRTALRVGLDHLDGVGTEPLLGLSVSRFGRSGSSLTLRYDHGPAYLHTYTLESALGEVAADRVEVVAFSPLGAEWSVSVAGELLRLAEDDAANTRLGGGVTLARRIDSWLTADVGTRVLGFTDAAPAPGRRLYWDPELFWSNTVGLVAAHRPERGLGYRFRLSGGAAWSDERDAPEGGWIPQFGAEAGMSWLSESARVDLTTFYRRSREDEYSSFGAELTLRIRP